MAETKKKLPKSEWEFSGLKPESATYAFFYEYSRQSDKIKKLVEAYRELIPYDPEYDPDKGWIFNSDKIKHLSKAKKDGLWGWADQFKISTYLSLIIWLSYCKKFPTTPFLELKTEDYRNGPEVPINVRVFPVNGRGFCDMGFCWWKDINDESFMMNLNSGVPFGIFHPVAGAGPDGEHISAHIVRVDWWKTDSELKEEFSEWLTAYRKFLKVKPVSAASRGLLNQPLDLPKECRKMETALVHLGKLRCLEAAGSWEKYLDVYHTEKSDRRYLQKDVSAARKIITWLEDKV